MKAKAHLVIIILACFGCFVYSQSKNENEKALQGNYFSIGAGLGKCYFGPTLSGEAAYGFGGNLLTVRFLQASEFNIGAENVFDKPEINFTEIGFLFGRQFKQNKLSLIICGGISYVKGIDRGKFIKEKEYDEIAISTIGFPAEVKVKIELSDYMGIGGVCFADFNKNKNLIGGLLELYFMLPL